MTAAPANDPTSSAVTPGPMTRAVVLLRTAPTSLAAVLGGLFPESAAAFAGASGEATTFNVNGVPLTVEIAQERLEARELDYAVSQSLVRGRVQAAVEEHRGYVIFTVLTGDDVFRAADVLSNVAATCADGVDGLAVWVPESDLATTDVLYAGEVARRPAHVWFNTMGARLDETTSIAHTIGVPHLGGRDVQLTSTVLDPAAAFEEVRGAVATLLEARTVPAAGTLVSIAGAPHVLTLTTSRLGLGEVLEPVPAPGAVGAGASEEKARRKGWFGRR